MDDESSSESDYGSDFSAGEESIVHQLLEDLGNSVTSSPKLPYGSPSSAHGTPLSALPFDAANRTTDGSPVLTLLQAEREARHHAPSLRTCSGDSFLGKIERPAVIREPDVSITHRNTRESIPLPAGDVRYPDLSHAISGSEPARRPKDSRSPLQRFRSFPKKPLTVSDLAAGAWCELQYWYTLTLLPGGRKTRTAAMRGGSRVHQTLEDEVHTTVQVNVHTKEEAFALRMWNVIQGLRTLRDAGMTRELEVWGVIEGQVVNGIVDEVSHESPDPTFEQELSQSESSKGFVTASSKQQTSMTDFLGPRRKRVYLTDVKTRGSDRLPIGAALRPARVQLFLYHRLLGEMASGTVDFAAIVDRYGLRADALFSDAFMAQVGDLHDEVFYDADSNVESSPLSSHSSRTGHSAKQPDARLGQPPQDLIRYRSIAQILPLLQFELRETFPHGAATLGDLLTVQYRHRDDGRVLGNNLFPNDPEALDGYIRENLKWWRGEKAAEGVCIEETYKCRSCEFANICQWRKEKEAELLQKRRSTTRVRS